MEVVESLAEPVSSVRVENYFFLLAITILYYDHFLTLDQEICAIWKRQTKFNWGCYLFLINRYVSFFGDIVAAVSLFYPSFSISSCKSFELYRLLVKIIIQAVIGVTISLRVYALYGCNRRLLVIFMTVIVIAFITYMVLFAAADPDPSSSPVYGCHSICDAASASKLVAGWGAILFFDAVLFGMTLFKAHQFKKDFDKVKVEMFSSTGSPSIRSIITRDGSIYFAGMALANLVNIVDFYFPGPGTKGGLAPLAGSISTTLTSRLILNLHQAARSGLFSTFADSNLECAIVECGMGSESRE